MSCRPDPRCWARHATFMVVMSALLAACSAAGGASDAEPESGDAADAERSDVRADAPATVDVVRDEHDSQSSDDVIDWGGVEIACGDWGEGCPCGEDVEDGAMCCGPGLEGDGTSVWGCEPAVAGSWRHWREYGGPCGPQDYDRCSWWR